MGVDILDGAVERRLLTQWRTYFPVSCIRSLSDVMGYDALDDHIDKWWRLSALTKSSEILIALGVGNGENAVDGDQHSNPVHSESFSVAVTPQELLTKRRPVACVGLVSGREVPLPSGRRYFMSNRSVNQVLDGDYHPSLTDSRCGDMACAVLRGKAVAMPQQVAESDVVYGAKFEMPSYHHADPVRIDSISSQALKGIHGGKSARTRF